MTVQEKIIAIAKSNKLIERVVFYEINNEIRIKAIIEWTEYPLISGVSYEDCLLQLEEICKKNSNS